MNGQNCLVDAATCARLVGMARSSLYRLAKAGRIPSYAAGPRLTGRRFDAAEVRQVLKDLARSQQLGHEHAAPPTRARGFVKPAPSPTRSK